MNVMLVRASFVLLAAAAAGPASAVEPADLSGWWAADPVHRGDSSHLALQFIDKDGKQEAHLSLPAIGAWDINLGDVAISGEALDTRGLSFPLTWNPASRTLSGVIPADAAPIYRIPVEFRRADPLRKPPAREWRAPRPKLRWSVDTGGAPIWAGIERDPESGVLFVGTEAGELLAISREGKTLWKFDTGKPIRAQPTLIDGFVHLHSDSGYLYRLTTAGAEVWRARVDAGSDPRLPTDAKGTRWDRYGSSVAAAEGRLYVASRDKHLYALDAKTGRELWRVAAGDILTATPALHAGDVIFAAYDGKVSAVSARDGSLRWTYDAKLAVAGDLTVSEGRVLLGSRSYDLVALDAATGRELWKHYYWFSWIESPPLVRDGVVYTGSSDATNVYAIGLADGRLRWKTAVPGFSWQRVAASDKWLVAGTTGAGAYPGPRAGSLVGMDRATGAVRWILLDPPTQEGAKKAWGFGASPVIAGDTVYAADLAGKLHAIALE